MEELLAKHKKEQRELQGRVTQKKKNATKKTRKGVNDECEILERELKERQQAEVDASNSGHTEECVNQLPTGGDLQKDGELATADEVVKKMSLGGGTTEEPQKVESQPQQKAKKPNRQKARLARRAADQEAEAVAAEKEAESMPDLREQELNAMKKELEKRGLVETFIQPDGHCLYSACAYSMDATRVKDSGPYSKPYQNVRFVTASYMSKHPDDFAPFVEEPLDSYVKKIEDTAEWGGHLELQAIARSYKVQVNVLQADGRIDVFETQQWNEESEHIWLAYYRHSFGLGEHYNALRKTAKT